MVLKKVGDTLLKGIIFLALAFPVTAWDRITADLDISCEQVAQELTCQYRTLDGEPLQNASALFKEQPLPVKLQASDNTESVAILFMVDTSDPARQQVIDIKKNHIREILARMKPGSRAGLAAFDRTLRIESPVNESDFLFGKKLESLQAVGKTTELYRNVIQALEYLARQDAASRVMFLLSDGQAEDKAYFHSDVVRVARQNGIIINSIGYPRTVSLSVALQTLRRLSEETGGRYVDTGINYQLPPAFLEQAYDNISHRGIINILLNDVKAVSDTATVKLTYSTGSGNNSVLVPVQPVRPAIATIDSASVATVATTSQADKTQPPVTIVTRSTDTSPINLWLWYGIPAAFIIIIIFILITLFLLWQRPAVTGTTIAPAYEFKPYAYLIESDDDNLRHPITRTICRIGRGKDNELVLDDSSISRRHAEIHRNMHGGFDIIDMNSMNGVFVNGERIGKAMLQEGDDIEIGDVSLKFSQLSPEHAEEEATVMQKTRTPGISIS